MDGTAGQTTRGPAVVIVGAGPTGLMLAGELALAGIEVELLEQRESQALAGSRAGGLHARTLEVLDQRGIVDRFLAEGQVTQVASFGWIRLDMSDFPTRHPHGLALPQNRIERLLAQWVRELGVPIRYRTRVACFVQDDEGVTVDLEGGGRLRAGYLVGCDGGRSLVRRTAGIDFPGWEATTSSLLAEVEMREDPPIGMRRDAHGTHGIGRVEYDIRDGEVVFADSGTLRVMITDPVPVTGADPTLEDVSQALVRLYGSDFGVHTPTWISRFSDASRQAAAYRAGRVLLAGDAAHIHSPVGGQGLNVGVQDAVNLGWKLARVVRGSSPEALLDSYHAERHPVAARVLRNTMAQVALLRSDDRTEALRDFTAELLAMDEPRRRFAAMMSGLEVRYDLGEGHPLLGRRMPDLELETYRGRVRTYTLLHDAQPVLVLLDRSAALPLEEVSVLRARYDGPWELPAVGAVPAPPGVLIRPDGHVAWAGEEGREGLDRALAAWFGRR